MRVTRLTLIALLTALLVGCGQRSSDQQKPDPRPGFDPSAPLANFPSTDPDATVLSYWRLIQTGAYPLALAGYDPEVLEAVSEEAMLAVIRAQRPGVAALKPRVTESRELANRHIVIVDARNASGEGGAYSFTLRRVGGQYRIVHDSLIEETFAATYAAFLTQSSENLTEKQVDSRANQAASAYRRAGVEAAS